MHKPAGRHSEGSTSKIRCAIYTRKSTEEGLEQEFNSLDAQREACAAYILSQRHEGWSELPDIYDDAPNCPPANCFSPPPSRVPVARGGNTGVFRRAHQESRPLDRSLRDEGSFVPLQPRLTTRRRVPALRRRRRAALTAFNPTNPALGAMISNSPLTGGSGWSWERRSYPLLGEPAICSKCFSTILFVLSKIQEPGR